MLSAEVILKTDKGKSLAQENALVTADSIASFHPSRENLAIVSKKFQELGFSTVDDGPTITIYGTEKLFEQKLGIADGILLVVPSDLLGIVDKIVLSTPVDYYQ